MDRAAVYKTAALPTELHRRVVPSMLADPPAGLRKPLTDLLFSLPDSTTLGPALPGGTRLALANTGQPWPGFRRCVSGMVPGSVV